MEHLISEGRKLHIHHIGGRFGNGGFPLLDRFEKDFVRVYYDADADCLSQVKERWKDSSAVVRVLPYCIGDRERRSNFSLNYDPTSSSLYRFSPEYRDFYFFCYNHDFIVSEAMRSMESREVDVKTLDALFYSGKADSPVPPDLLSLDVQGSEYAVLEGGRAVLEKDILAVTLEAWFHPVYSGQRLFGDISHLLSLSGFHFVKFLKFTEYSPSRRPVGLRGEGFQVFADALFLKKIDAVAEHAEDASAAHVQMRKLAFISLVYHQSEYALACLEKSRSLVAGLSDDLSGIALYDFLGEVEISAGKTIPVYPPTFPEKYPYEVSRLRFASREVMESSTPHTGSRQKAFALQFWLRHIYPRIYGIARVYDFLLEKVWALAGSVILPDSRIEKTLRRSGLGVQARLLKKKRVVQSLFSRRRRPDAPAGEEEMKAS